jgi:hypothetical protein
MTAMSNEHHGPIVRPYARIGGRTRPRVDLPLEALITTTPRGRSGDGVGHPDHREIAELCHEIRSVAEVAALIEIPLGLARVLIADMAEMGLVAVHDSTSAPTGAPCLALLERVLSGLRRL